MFEIFYHPDTKKDIKNIDRQNLILIKNSIESKVATNPTNLAKPLRGNLKNIWSLRVGDFRIIFKIDDNKIVILRIAHRKEVYEAGIIFSRIKKLI